MDSYDEPFLDGNDINKINMNRLKGAITSGDPDKVKELIDGGVNPNMTITIESKSGNFTHNPLTLALKESDPKKSSPVIDELLSNGADINISVNLDRTGAIKGIAEPGEGIPLTRYLADQGREDVFQMLSDKKLLSKEKINGDYLLHAAILDGNDDVKMRSSKIAELLVKNGADVNQPTPKNGNTPAHLAVNSNNAKVLEMLIKNGADLDIKNKDGKTVLELAESKLAQYEALPIPKEREINIQKELIATIKNSLEEKANAAAQEKAPPAMPEPAPAPKSPEKDAAPAAPPPPAMPEPAPAPKPPERDAAPVVPPPPAMPESAPTPKTPDKDAAPAVPPPPAMPEPAPAPKTPEKDGVTGTAGTMSFLEQNLKELMKSANKLKDWATDILAGKPPEIEKNADLREFGKPENSSLAATNTTGMINAVAPAAEPKVGGVTQEQLYAQILAQKPEAYTAMKDSVSFTLGNVASADHRNDGGLSVNGKGGQSQGAGIGSVA